MKKYSGIMFGILLGLSLGFASAQNVQVSGSVCAEWNKDANGNNISCKRYVNASVGTTQTGTAQTGVYGTTGAYGATGVQTGAYGTGGYTTGANNRQLGANQADLSFFANLISGVGGLVRLLPPILLGIAVVVFFYFLIRYLIGGKVDATEKGKNLKSMMFSLGAIFIMVTLWGIIAFFGDFIGINSNVQVSAPTLPR